MRKPVVPILIIVAHQLLLIVSDRLDIQDYTLTSLFLSLYKRSSCQTLSNAFDKSRKTPCISVSLGDD